MGLQIGAGAIGGLISPVLVGWLADEVGYRTAFAVLIVPLTFAVVMVLMMTRPQSGNAEDVRIATA